MCSGIYVLYMLEQKDSSVLYAVPCFYFTSSLHEMKTNKLAVALVTAAQWACKKKFSVNQSIVLLLDVAEGSWLV